MKQILKWFHWHDYTYKYVASRYRSFNSRDVIVECKCGKRKLIECMDADCVLPRIETMDFYEVKKFMEYLTNGKYHVNSETHNQLWQNKY